MLKISLGVAQTSVSLQLVGAGKLYFCQELQLQLIKGLRSNSNFCLQLHVLKILEEPESGDY